MSENENLNQYRLTIEFIIWAENEEEAEDMAWSYARIRIPKKYVDRSIQPDHVFQPELV